MSLPDSGKVAEMRAVRDAELKARHPFGGSYLQIRNILGRVGGVTGLSALTQRLTYKPSTVLEAQNAYVGVEQMSWTRAQKPVYAKIRTATPLIGAVITCSMTTVWILGIMNDRKLTEKAKKKK